MVAWEHNQAYHKGANKNNYFEMKVYLGAFVELNPIELFSYYGLMFESDVKYLHE